MSIRLEIDHSRQESGKEKRQEQLDRWEASETNQCKYYTYTIIVSNSITIYIFFNISFFRNSPLFKFFYDKDINDDVSLTEISIYYYILFGPPLYKLKYYF